MPAKLHFANGEHLEVPESATRVAARPSESQGSHVRFEVAASTYETTIVYVDPRHVVYWEDLAIS